MVEPARTTSGTLWWRTTPPAFGPGEETATKVWFKTYLEWLTTAKNARAEHAAKNNHGSWFPVQIIPIALYTGNEELVRQLCAEDQARIAAQFLPDGRQPEEIRRVDGLSDSLFNLEAQFQIARLAAGLGIELWHDEAPGHGSLRVGFEFLKPFNARPETWPTSQNVRLPAGFLDPLAREAAIVWGRAPAGSAPPSKP